jgi:hypothetical protein
MSEKLPEPAWFEEVQRSFQVYWEKTPWHTLGDTTLATLKPMLRKYGAQLQKLPDNFLPSVMDQYLAARWHVSPFSARQDGEGPRFGSAVWRYVAFSVLEDLGGYRFWCQAEDGGEFGLYSDGVADSLRQGYTLFFCLVVGVEGIWHLTYGPILGWKGLVHGDLSYLASKVAAQLYANSGFHAVVLASPVSFWVSWSLGDAPAVYHGDQPVLYCWCEGRLAPRFDEKLPSTWKRADAGARSCWTYKETDYFKQRRIFLDRKSGKALLFALRPDDFNRLLSKLGARFTPDVYRSNAISFLMFMILKSILHREVEFEPWLRPFERRDTESPPPSDFR